jgi:RHS repeat-associated protein
MYHFFADHLGTTRIVTDASGNVCYDADYYPFQGERTPYVNTCTPAYKMAGMKFDQESGDYYTLNRYYPPNLGRWLSPDPLSGDVTNPQSLNRYAYVLNNPTTFIDPLGLCGEPDDWDPTTNTLTGHPPCGSRPMETPASIGSRWYACMSASPWCPNGLYNTSPFAVDPSDPCSTWMGTDASCQQMPGLFNNGQPIYGGGGVSVSAAGWGGGGGVWNEAIPPFGGGGFGLPCDFGACGAPTWTPFVSDVSVVNGEFTMYATVWQLMELPLNLAALRNAGRIAAPVASPWAPVVWYGGSAAVALSPAHRGQGSLGMGVA